MMFIESKDIGQEGKSGTNFVDVLDSRILTKIAEINRMMGYGNCSHF